MILKHLPLPGLTKTGKNIFLVFLALTFSLAPFSFPVFAFNTFPSSGNIHRAILEEGLQPFGLSKGSLRILAKGMDSQDNPFSRNWLESQKHACDNRIREAFQYIDEQTDRAVDLAGNALSDEKARENALYALGEGMHTLHDFYSHANYVEWLVRNKRPLEPIDRAKNSQLPEKLRSCYYFYASTFKQEPFLSHEENVRRLKLKYPNMSFRSEAEYAARKKSEKLEEALDYVLKPGQFMHMEVNKDSAGQMEGRIKCGLDGETLFSVARKLAVLDTTRQWQCFEQRLRAKYGSQAEAILTALKGGSSEKVQELRQEPERKAEPESEPKSEPGAQSVMEEHSQDKMPKAEPEMNESLPEKQTKDGSDSHNAGSEQREEKDDNNHKPGHEDKKDHDRQEKSDREPDQKSDEKDNLGD